MAGRTSVAATANTILLTIFPPLGLNRAERRRGARPQPTCAAILVRRDGVRIVSMGDACDGRCWTVRVIIRPVVSRDRSATMDVLIIGGGIGGLTLGLALHRAGVPCRVYEAAPQIKPIGVGINLLPHATKELFALGLGDELAKVAVTTKESAFFNRFGQLIYREPLGRYAGYDWPQFSIHRADLHDLLLDAFRERAGRNR